MVASAQAVGTWHRYQMHPCLPQLIYEARHTFEPKLHLTHILKVAFGQLPEHAGNIRGTIFSIYWTTPMLVSFCSATCSIIHSVRHAAQIIHLLDSLMSSFPCLEVLYFLPRHWQHEATHQEALCRNWFFTLIITKGALRQATVLVRSCVTLYISVEHCVRIVLTVEDSPSSTRLSRWVCVSVSVSSLVCSNVLLSIRAKHLHKVKHKHTKHTNAKVTCQQ